MITSAIRSQATDWQVRVYEKNKYHQWRCKKNHKHRSKNYHMYEKITYQQKNKLDKIVHKLENNFHQLSAIVIMKKFCFIFVLYVTLQQIDGAKVLGILPFQSSSHFAIGRAIVKSLHSVGHEVTVVSPYPQKKSLTNYTDISIADIVPEYKQGPNSWR